MRETRELAVETTMGIILEFRRGEEAASRIVKPESGSLGEIIIFPGVRIERRASSDTPDEAGTPSRRRAQRGRKK
ncbi:MAG TPA: hypothetical protein VK193_03145 [Methyloceanibacter sp.]|jgi:hypothetical protein|nr:hypothetical protein [Methyloceanibacter sp.]